MIAIINYEFAESGSSWRFALDMNKAFITDASEAIRPEGYCTLNKKTAAEISAAV